MIIGGVMGPYFIRWSNGSIFYNPAILRRRGLKTDLSYREMLTPSLFGFKNEVSWRMDLRSLFNDSIFLTHDELNLKYGTKINFLHYISLKKTLEANLVDGDGNRLNLSMIPKDTHWVNTLTGLFNKTKKGSKTFRKVLGSNSPVKIDFNIDKWIKLLRTNRICESEIQAGYRNMQTRLFPRQLLDLKIRLLLG